METQCFCETDEKRIDWIKESMLKLVIFGESIDKSRSADEPIGYILEILSLSSSQMWLWNLFCCELPWYLLKTFASVLIALKSVSPLLAVCTPFSCNSCIVLVSCSHVVSRNPIATNLSLGELNPWMLWKGERCVRIVQPIELRSGQKWCENK